MLPLLVLVLHQLNMCAWKTAVAVATEQVAAQEVFIKGHVRISGDSQRIMDSLPVFAALDAAFASVRSETVYE